MGCILDWLERSQFHVGVVTGHFIWEDVIVRNLLILSVLVGLLSGFASLPEIASAEVLSVCSDGTHVQSQPLTVGVDYTVEATGAYYYYTGQPPKQEDALWYQSNGTDWDTEAPSLWLDHQSVGWLGTTDGSTFLAHTYSPTHVYRDYVIGTGQPVDFVIMDSYYGDNSGGLQVTITSTSVPEPATVSLLITALLGLGAVLFVRRRPAA
jgi:hypothetical protein